MGEDPGTVGAPVAATDDPEQIRQRIEATRRELGDTVEALAAKTDAKARVRDRIRGTKASDVTHVATRNPLPLAIAGAFAAGFLVGRLTKR